MTTKAKIAHYLTTWSKQGYSSDIPDDVPDELMHERLAPSYKAIAIALLRNDHALQSLGFQADESMWYGVLKRIELSERTGAQQGLPL